MQLRASRPAWLLVAILLISSCTSDSDEDSLVVRFDAAQAYMAVDSLTVSTSNGLLFRPSGDVKIVGVRDPNNESTQLNLTWFEHGTEMRVFMTFNSDGSEWWASDIRSYDGNTNGEWVKEAGEFLRTPVGTEFDGDLELGQLSIKGLQLQAFTMPDACIDPAERLAIVPLTRVVQGTDAPGVETGIPIMVVDTRTCEQVNDLRGLELEGISEKTDIVTVGPFEQPRPGTLGAPVAIKSAGQTTLRLTARSNTGAIVDTIEVPVHIRRDVEPGFTPTTRQ